MIIEFLMNISFGVINMLLSALPDIEFSIDTGAIGKFFDFIDIVLYFFPLITIGNIIKLIFGIIAFRIIISITKTLMQIIPFV